METQPHAQLRGSRCTLLLLSALLLKISQVFVSQVQCITLLCRGGFLSAPPAKVRRSMDKTKENGNFFVLSSERAFGASLRGLERKCRNHHGFREKIHAGCVTARCYTICDLIFLTLYPVSQNVRIHSHIPNIDNMNNI